MVERLLKWLGDVDSAAHGGDYSEVLQLLERHYVQATKQQREAMRAALRADRVLDAQLCEQLQRAAAHAQREGDHAASLQIQLLIVSLAGAFDSRDVLLDLAETWRWAEEQGIDPLPAYREIGAVSSSQADHVVGGSVRAMILRVAEDAAYREQLRR